jgi:hypothetical protein
VSRDNRTDHKSDRARQSEARKVIGEYHEQQQRVLLERVRAGLARLDAGEIDPFELDELIHHYHRASQKLWAFCQRRSGQALRAVALLELAREDDDEYDWWEIGDADRRR